MPVTKIRENLSLRFPTVVSRFTQAHNATVHFSQSGSSCAEQAIDTHMFLQPPIEADLDGTRARAISASPREMRAVGTIIPHKYSAMKGRGFSSFLYDSSPPTASKQAKNQHNARAEFAAASSRPPRPQSAPWLSSLPMQPKQAGAFQRFRYTINPYEALQESNWQYAKKEHAKIRAGAFKPGGKGADARRRSLKLRAGELMADLLATLRADWPSFIKVSTVESNGTDRPRFLGPRTCPFAFPLITCMRRMCRMHAASVHPIAASVLTPTASADCKGRARDDRRTLPSGEA